MVKLIIWNLLYFEMEAAIDTYSSPLICRNLLFILGILSAAEVGAAPGDLEIWFRAFIPSPALAGKAKGFIVDVPNAAIPSIVRLLPTDAVNVECFATDHRGFSSSPGSTARAETRFTLRPVGMIDATVLPVSGRTSASPTTKTDCATGAAIKTETAKVNRDHVGTPSIIPGQIQVIGQAEATNVIAAGGLAPSIDYSFDIKWSPLHGALEVGVTYGVFPAFEVYAKSGLGDWVPVMQRQPDGNPWHLGLDGFGVGTAHDTQKLTLYPFAGTWQTQDPDRRFSFEFVKDKVRWIERNAGTGAVLTREVDLVKNSDGTLSLRRANDAEVLAFLGFPAPLIAEILARGPAPSFAVFSLGASGLVVQWNGLLITKDAGGKLKEVVQPGVRPSKSFDLAFKG